MEAPGDPGGGASPPPSEPRGTSQPKGIQASLPTSPREDGEMTEATPTSSEATRPTHDEEMSEGRIQPLQAGQANQPRSKETQPPSRAYLQEVEMRMERMERLLASQGYAL